MRLATSEVQAILTQSLSSKYRCQMGAIEPPTCPRVSTSQRAWHQENNGSKGAHNLGENKLGSCVLDLSDVDAHSGALAQRFRCNAGQGRDGPPSAAGGSDCRSAMNKGGLA